ncbi:flavin reductase family protein, partial [Hansschlegelia beijingensis]
MSGPATDAAQKPPATSVVEDFKAAFRRLASGVCVVTFKRGEDLHGFTATSVTSISADPPMLLFCVSRRSDSFDSMVPGARIGVSVLSEEQRGLSDAFASKVLPGRYRHIPSSRLGGAPVLRDALARISAVVVQIVPAGDNIVGARTLATSSISDALKKACPPQKLTRFRFPESTRWRFGA